MNKLVILFSILLVNVLVITGCSSPSSTTTTTSAKAATPAPTTTAAPITTAAPATTPAPTSAVATTTTTAPTTTAPTTTTTAPTTTAAPTKTPAPATTRPALPAGSIYWDQATDPKYLDKTVTMIGPCIGTYVGHDMSLVLGTTLPAAGSVPTDVNVGPGFFLVGLRKTSLWPDLASLQMYVGKTVAVTCLLDKNPYTDNLEMQLVGTRATLDAIKILP